MIFPFDKIICLHLVEDKKRYNSIINQVKYFGVEDKFEFWYTCKKSPITNLIGNNMDNLKDGYYENKIKTNPNVYGNVFDCAYNHYNIIKTAYLRGFNNILIIEDDILFNKDKNFLEILFNDIPQDYNIIKFYYSFDYNKFNISELKYVDKSYKQFYKYMFSTLCYGLSRKGMEIIIDEYENNFAAADVILENIKNNDEKNDKYYILSYQKLCKPIGDNSNIV